MRHIARAELTDLSAGQTREVLGADVSACLAFVDAEGYPRQLPCWFLWHDGAFHITSLADKFHVRRLKADARASICVELTEAMAGRWANRQVKGVGRIEIFPDADGHWSRRIREKYLGEVRIDGSGAPDRVVLRLRPRRLIAHGGGLVLREDGVHVDGDTVADAD